MGPNWKQNARFPILVKWLDCKERLSLQVHPPKKIAKKLGGQPKTENWYVANTTENSGLFIGFKKITEGHGSFLQGKKGNNLLLEELNILPLICYEIIFPELTQKANKNTNLIVNISEDGWFGHSIGPQQHFAKAIFRSIENNSFLVRSANKGISAIINNKGEIVKRLNTFETGSIEMDIPLLKTEYKNKNDLIFFILLFTYLTIFFIFKNKD